ncbi:MAG: hypothetical protein KIH89_000510 [Candidatus Shapirobacteria bacterium]|nr:hypothetical protein [Candidatus Shapirobacteria bacterium]
MTSQAFFNYSMVFLGACIVLSFGILALLFFRSNKRTKHRFEFLALLSLAVWQVIMFASFMCILGWGYFFDSLSYAAGIWAAVFCLFLARSLRRIQPVKLETLISVCILTIICFIPGFVLFPTAQVSPIEHMAHFGSLAFVYYLYLFVILGITSYHLLKVNKLKSFVASRSLLFVFIVVLLLNCALNVFLPFVIVSIVFVDAGIVNVLQVLCTALTSLLFFSFLYTSIAYEYLDIQLSIQKRRVYFLSIGLVYLLSITFLFFLAQLTQQNIAVWTLGILLVFVFYKKISILIEKLLDSYFFFDAFDSQVRDMKEIDEKLGRTSMQKLVTGIELECVRVHILPLHAFIALRDQYTLRDVFTKKRISEKDPRMLGVYHLPRNIFSFEDLQIVRHRYVRDIERFMRKSQVNMVYVFHNHNAIVGFMLFKSSSSTISEAQHTALEHVEKYVVDYLTHRETLFAVRSN